jgi:hypothetical protein
MNQLCMTTIPVFQQSVLKWQQEYFENTLQLTPTSLVIKADQECQVLKHEGQWVEILDPSILALHALICTNKLKSGEVFTQLAAQFSQKAARYTYIVRSLKPMSRSSGSNQTPEWLLDLANDPDQIKLFNCHY